jgi:aspartyl-tRNA(Asn)/glutamyl-tRNA(Gln) amidotransferase subunit B
MNSFKGVRSALEYEVKRQTELLLEGDKIIQETRLWDEDRQLTFSMRSKEEAHDYRYFPDPDLVPFTLNKEFVAGIEDTLPEFPKEKISRYTKEFGLSQKEADIIVQDKQMCDFFESCTNIYTQPRKIYNWLTGVVLAYMNDRKKEISQLNLSSRELVRLIKYVDEGKLNNLAAKDVLFAVLDEAKDADSVIKEKGLIQVSDAGELEKFADAVIKDNPKSVQDFLAGKENAIMFLVGQVMKVSKGKANPKIIKELLVRKLMKT